MDYILDWVKNVLYIAGAIYFAIVVIGKYVLNK